MNWKVLSPGSSGNWKSRFSLKSETQHTASELGTYYCSRREV